MVSTYEKSFDRVSRNWRAEKVLLDSLPHLDKSWVATKGKGEPCKQGETAARSECIPASKDGKTVDVRPDSEEPDNDRVEGGKDKRGWYKKVFDEVLEKLNLEAGDPKKIKAYKERIFDAMEDRGYDDERFLNELFNKAIGVKSDSPRDQPDISGSGTPTKTSSKSSEKSSEKLSKLKSSKVINRRRLSGDGVNQTYIITLEDGSKGVWKPAVGEASGMRESVTCCLYIREAASFTIAESLGMEDLVPPTTIREVDGQIGSVQEFKGNTIKAAEVDHAYMKYDGNEDLARAAAFDYLLGNTDRHPGNWLVDKDTGKLVLIDHGFSIPSIPGESGALKLVNAARERNLKVPESVKNLNWDELEESLQPYRTNDVNNKEGLTDDDIALLRTRLEDLQSYDTIKDVTKKGSQMSDFCCWGPI